MAAALPSRFTPCIPRLVSSAPLIAPLQLARVRLVLPRAFSTTKRLRTHSSSLDIRKPELTPDCLQLPSTFAPHRHFSVPYTWIRDHCPCEHCIHPSTKQKLHSCADVIGDVRPKAIRVVQHAQKVAYEITWNRSGLDRVDPDAAKIARDQKENETDHVSTIPASFLAEYFDPASAAYRFPLHPTPVLWDRAKWEDTNGPARKNMWVDYAEFMDEGNEGLLRALRQIGKYGLVFLKNVPVDLASTEAVANRIGNIRDTFYGQTWNVVSVPDAKNIAYTSLHLNLHMDLLYFESPPGLQFLHCLKHTVKGGASTFLDSFAVAELLRIHYPEDYEVLRRIPVTFHYVNDGHHMHYRRPTIVTPVSNETVDTGTIGSVTAGNEPLIINYAPPFQGPLENISVQDSKAFYKAFRRFANITEGKDPSVWSSLPSVTSEESSSSSSPPSSSSTSNPLLYSTTLRTGDLVIFANRRVLHGRTSFDPSSGERHFRGTYVDGDDFRDKWRVLEKKIGDWKS